MDTGAAFTGGAGNDTLVATVATMGALDVSDGGAGTDTFSINESVDVTSIPGAYTGYETMSVSSTGNIGAIKVSATAAVKQKDLITVSAASSTSQKYDV